MPLFSAAGVGSSRLSICDRSKDLLPSPLWLARSGGTVNETKQIRRKQQKSFLSFGFHRVVLCVLPILILPAS